MKVAIYQPYFFPYLGYWQLFNLVDRFVILDDVDYIKRGYINRNSILVNGKPYMFTLSVKKPSQNRLINQTELFFPIEERESFLKTVTMAYKRAPYYGDIILLLNNIVLFDESDLTMFIINSMERVKEYLNIDTEIMLSSRIEKDNSLKGEQRIIEICKQVGADEYINAIGGQDLYNRDDFARENIELYFLQTLPYNYKQFKNDFVPGLSFIDVLMFNSKEQIRILLECYGFV